MRPATYPDPNQPGEVIGITELERRGEYVGGLEAKVGIIPVLIVNMVKDCLHNRPILRPTAVNCLDVLEEVGRMLEDELVAGSYTIDMSKIRLQKEIVTKNRRVMVLERQTVSEIHIFSVTPLVAISSAYFGYRNDSQLKFV